MVKLVIKIKGVKEPVIENVVNSRRDEMELARNVATIICSQGIYIKDQDEEYTESTLVVKTIKGMGDIGEGENGTYYPPHRIEVIKIHEQ
jgi:hypothetical protein